MGSKTFAWSFSSFLPTHCREDTSNPRITHPFVPFNSELVRGQSDKTNLRNPRVLRDVNHVKGCGLDLLGHAPVSAESFHILGDVLTWNLGERRQGRIGRTYPCVESLPRSTDSQTYDRKHHFGVSGNIRTRSGQKQRKATRNGNCPFTRSCNFVNNRHEPELSWQASANQNNQRLSGNKGFHCFLCFFFFSERETKPNLFSCQFDQSFEFSVELVLGALQHVAEEPNQQRHVFLSTSSEQATS